MNVYTLTDAQGVGRTISGPVVITDEQRIDTEEESAFALGAPIGSYVPCEVQIAYDALGSYDDELLARWKITRTVVEDPPPPPPTPPAEVPMYRVKIVLAQQGLTAGVTSYISTLGEPAKTIAQTLWDDAPNLVVQGDFALQVKAAMELSDEQYQALISAALALTL